MEYMLHVIERGRHTADIRPNGCRQPLSSVLYSLCFGLALLLFSLALSGCDELFPSADNIDDFFGEDDEEQVEPMKVTGVEFMPGYKEFSVRTKILRDIGPYFLGDSSQVKISVHETADGIPLNRASQPSLTRIRNVEADAIDSAGVKMLVLVDLTLPQDVVDHERRFVGEALVSFSHENLYVAFLRGDSVSETLLATKYVVDNYFVSQPAPTKLLYRAILKKKNEIVDNHPHWYGDKHCVLLVMSDGKVYSDNNIPMDADHYMLQQQLMAPRTAADKRLVAYFVDVNDSKKHSNEIDNDVLKVFCSYNRGTCLKGFHWIGFRDILYARLGIKTDDDEFILTNPDYRIYRGSLSTVTFNIKQADTDSLIASVPASFRLGSIYDPIIVNGRSIYYVVAAGLILGFIILLGVWLLFQFVIPYIRYRLFLKKYVITYTGGNMSVGGHAVAKKCYLCKGDFLPGEQVVVKCEHTMHKNCWDDNDYHCPEYSDRCKDGSHYYNHHQLYDPRNASFYMKWVLVAIVTAIVAWVVFITFAHRYSGVFFRILILFIYGVDGSSAEGAEVLDHYNVFVNLLPSFGLTIGFFLTSGFAYLTIRHRSLKHRVQQILMRSMMASIACFLLFLFARLLAGLLRITDYTLLFDWVPWTIMAFIIAFSATVGTRIRLRKLLVFLAVITGFLSMYIWPPLFAATQVDFRVLILVSFILFSVGLSLCIAHDAPQSDRYFLHVSGAVKDMDIALYKWFRSDPHSHVTLGRSIDSSLQLSWDTEGVVAPQHAEIYLDGDVVMLHVLEGEVFVDNRLMKDDEACELYHGRQFTIGRTNFVYVEKDK